MHCAEIQSWLSDSIDALLKPAEVALLREHMAGCLKCRTQLASLQSMTRTLRTLEAPQVHDLREGVREQLITRPRLTTLWQRFLAPWPESLPLHGTAVAVTALLILVVIGRSPSPTTISLEDLRLASVKKHAAVQHAMSDTREQRVLAVGAQGLRDRAYDRTRANASTGRMEPLERRLGLESPAVQDADRFIVGHVSAELGAVDPIVQASVAMQPRRVPSLYELHARHRDLLLSQVDDAVFKGLHKSALLQEDVQDPAPSAVALVDTATRVAQPLLAEADVFMAQTRVAPGAAWPPRQEMTGAGSGVGVVQVRGGASVATPRYDGGLIGRYYGPAEPIGETLQRRELPAYEPLSESQPAVISWTWRVQDVPALAAYLKYWAITIGGELLSSTPQQIIIRIPAAFRVQLVDELSTYGQPAHASSDDSLAPPQDTPDALPHAEIFIILQLMDQQ